MKFSDLPRASRRALARKMGEVAYKVARRQGYDVVTGPDQLLRPRATVELKGEDDSLPAYNRLKMFNLARQGLRNGDSMRALITQLELNVVGTVGGKASFTCRGGDDIRRAFAAWSSHCEFSDDLNLGKVLTLIEDTKFWGGDMVLVFDDNLIEDSGRLLAFEPDEMADIPAAWFREKFGDTWTQRQGRIYNHNNRFVGVMVSHKYRGRTTFPRDPEGVLFLLKDPTQPLQDWQMLRSVWRFNQGRGVPPVSAPLDSLLDLESVTKFEVQSAMKNAQTLGTITHPSAKEADPDEIPDELTPEAARELGLEVDGDSVDTASAASSDDSQELALDNIAAAGTIFDVLPDDCQMSLLDTKHPNPNMEAFIKWLSSRAGAALGLARCYANMEASTSYTAFRGEQVMTWPAFEREQKDLERDVLDWLVQKWYAWASRHGFINAALVGDDWHESIHWAWPKMREVNQKQAYEATQLGLASGQLTMEDIVPGGDREAYVRKLASDAELMHKAGLRHWMDPDTSKAAAPLSETNKETDDNE